MKRYITGIIGMLLFTGVYSQVGLYLGVRGGAGAMLTQNQVTNLPTTEGFDNVFSRNSAWSGHAKGEALLGLWRFRLGYQFLYNFSGPSVVSVQGNPEISPAANTTYFNNSQTHIFGQYFLGEIVLIKTRHFNLVPGVAVGSYTGYKVDDNTGDHVSLSTTTNRRFSIGGELNAEIVYGRCTFLVGPNYYLFSYRDKFNDNWREYQHFIGADVGFRVNLLKPRQ
jgi:hypothetical protein